MKAPIWLSFFLPVLLAMSSGACSLLPMGGEPPPSPSTPLFIPGSDDQKLFQALIREQGDLLLTCEKERSCDRVHFTLALVALYDSRELATQHFRAVILAAPTSRLAASSLTWLKFLQVAPPHASGEEPAVQVTDRLVRDYLDRELAVQQLFKEQKQSVILSLQRELKAKERRIELLTSQLEALKHIDEELREKTRPLRPLGKTQPRERERHP